MKKEIIKLIKILGIGLTELVIDFELDLGEFNSIEWDKSDNKIYLHSFRENDLDIVYDFDDLGKSDKMKIYTLLSSILYN